MSLPLILGKNISGDPVIADLGADAASARRRHHRLGQVGRPQLHDPVAALPHGPRRMPDDHDRSQDARTEHLRRHPAFARAGGDRAGQGDPRAQMDRRADGGTLSDDGQPRRAPARQLQPEGARRQGQGRATRAQGPDRLQCRKRPADLRDRGTGLRSAAADRGGGRRACRSDDDRGQGGRIPHPAAGAESARRGHPPDHGDPAARRSTSSPA